MYRYEWAIYTEGIQRDSPLWSCKNCWYAFYFPCLNPWAGSNIGKWHCPIYKNENRGAPEALCWCGRAAHKDLEEPNGNSSLGTCGEKTECGAMENPCIKTCENICHHGPCKAPKCSMLCTKGIKDSADA